MRLLPRRWRLRTLMIAVAVVAAALGGWLAIEHRRVDFRRRAVYHLDQRIDYEIVRSGHWGLTHRNDSCSEFQAEGYPPTRDGKHWHPIRGLPKRVVREWVEYHRAQEQKYWAAARAPWLPVAPDPPMPPEPPDHESEQFKP